MYTTVPTNPFASYTTPPHRTTTHYTPPHPTRPSHHPPPPPAPPYSTRPHPTIPYHTPPHHTPPHPTTPHHTPPHPTTLSRHITHIDILYIFPLFQYSVCMFSRSVHINKFLFTKSKPVIISTTRTQDDTFHVSLK